MLAMRSRMITALTLVLVTTITASASAYEIKDFRLHTSGGRLTYSMVICTATKATLKLTGTFTPTAKGGGLKTAKPGSMQYQDKGCYPAAVSAPVRRNLAPCAPQVCAVKKGRTYRVSVHIVDQHTKRARTTPKRTARA